MDLPQVTRCLAFTISIQGEKREKADSHRGLPPLTVTTPCCRPGTRSQVPGVPLAHLSQVLPAALFFCPAVSTPAFSHTSHLLVVPLCLFCGEFSVTYVRRVRGRGTPVYLRRVPPGPLGRPECRKFPASESLPAPPGIRSSPIEPLWPPPPPTHAKKARARAIREYVRSHDNGLRESPLWGNLGVWRSFPGVEGGRLFWSRIFETDLVFINQIVFKT